MNRPSRPVLVWWYNKIMKVILIHGKDAKLGDKWYPWFREQMETKGIEVHIPELPNPSDPNLDEWLKVIKNLHLDEDTILAGHSRGGVAVLRYLERLSEGARVKKVILLAANSGFVKNMDHNQNSNGFYTEKGYDFEKIKSHCSDFVAFHSEDDKWVPFEHGKENVEGLSARFITFKDKGHFGKNNGIVPGLIEEIAKKV